MRRPKRRNKPGKKSILIIALVLIITVGIVFLLLKKKGNVNNVEVVEDVKIVEDANQKEQQVFGETVLFEEVDVFFTASGHDAGFARRNIENNVFTYVMVADLPLIDLETQYYEAWLVKPGVTEFFSTGEMFAREDGKFGLVWEQDLEKAKNDLFEFTRIVVTRESRDGDSAPSPAHVAEGEF